MSAPARTAVATMRAARLAAAGRFDVVTREAPEPGPRETLVRLEGCGVCASSLPVWEGRPWFAYPLEPGAPGHEGWGVEVESGRRVAVLSLHAFAEYVSVPVAEVVALPPELDGVPFPGEAAACALNVFSRSGVGRGDTVGIVGAGWLGLLLVQLATAAGAHVLAFSRRESSRALARDFGAETPAEPEPESCDVAVEAAGVQETLDLASGLCRVGGRLVVAGFHQDGLRTIDLQSWNWRGLDVVNAHERDPRAYLNGLRAAVDAARSGRIDVAPLVTHEFPLEHVDDAFELLRTRPEGFVKAVIRL
ncbi:MAG TPA: zinc-binding dehydrogenase [Gaiellaceae bacterium]|nr:zinc-binding dehydrogenase [Gaiellaceae bacterium]